MSTLQIGLAAAVAVLLALAWWALRRRDAGRDERDADRIDTVIGWPPRATRVLSSPERMAYVTLVRALPDHMVLAQVPLARFLTVPKRNSYADWLRRVGYQSADFVICDTASQVVAVVELQSPQASERARKRMARIARTLEAAQIPLHVWNDGNLPSVDAARLALVPAPPAGTAASPLPPSAGPALGLPTAATAATATVAAAAASPNPFDDSSRDSTQDERIEFLDPPPTWYDDLDSGAVPLDKRDP